MPPAKSTSGPDRGLLAFAQEVPRVTILSDHAAEGTPEENRSPDFLDLRTRLAAVYDIIRHVNTRCPVTIGIYGDWGCGKTSAMRWLESRLREWNELDDAGRGEERDKKAVTTPAHPLVHPVWFDPWKYHKREDVWRGIISEVILAMLKVNSLQGERKAGAIKFAAKRFGTFLGRAFLKSLSHIKFKFGGKSGSGKEGPALEGGAEISGEVFEDIHEEWKHFTHPEKGYLNEFEDALKTFIERCLPSVTGTRGERIFSERIVLFIDDLDRCLPEVTLEVLEALKLYLNIPALIFVVGLDHGVVQNIVREHYQKQGVGTDKSRQYLAKLFQVELHITPSSTQMEGFLDKQLAALDGATGKYWSKTLGEEYGDRIRGILQKLAAGNPREVKRLLNSSLIYARSLSTDITLTAQRHGPEVRLFFAQGVALYFLRYLIDQRYYSSIAGFSEYGWWDFSWFEEASKIRRTDGWTWDRLINVSGWGQSSGSDSKLSSGKNRADFLLDKNPSRQEIEQEKKSLTGWEKDWAELYAVRPSLTEDALRSGFYLDPLLWDILAIPFSSHVALRAPASLPNQPAVPAFALESLPPKAQEILLQATGQSRDTFDPASLSTLTTLKLLDVGLTDTHLSFLSRCSALAHLELDDNPITDEGLSHLRHLPLRRLDLLQTRVSKVVALQAIESLTVISLSDCMGLSAVDQLPPSLIDLYLHGCTGLRAVDNLPRSLTWLSLHGCTGLSTVDHLPQSLTVLSLAGCTGLRAVDHLPQSLTVLSLAGCTGLSTVDHLPQSLTNLDLHGCTRLSATAVARVKAALPNCKVVSP